MSLRQHWIAIEVTARNAGTPLVCSGGKGNWWEKSMYLHYLNMTSADRITLIDRLNYGAGDSLLRKLETSKAPISKGGRVAKAVRQDAT